MAARSGAACVVSQTLRFLYGWVEGLEGMKVRLSRGRMSGDARLMAPQIEGLEGGTVEAGPAGGKRKHVRCAFVVSSRICNRTFFWV